MRGDQPLERRIKAMKLFYAKFMLPFTDNGAIMVNPCEDTARYRYFDSVDHLNAFLQTYPEDVYEAGEAVFDTATGELRPVLSTAQKIECINHSSLIVLTTDCLDKLLFDDSEAEFELVE